LEKLEVIQIWVRHSGFPLILWSNDIFGDIGNLLGFFCEAHNTHKISRYMGMAKLFVGLNVSKVLVISIIIRHGNSIYKKEIDYEGIPSKCGKCHSYSNLVYEFFHSSKRKKWVRKEQFVEPLLLALQDSPTREVDFEAPLGPDFGETSIPPEPQAQPPILQTTKDPLFGKHYEAFSPLNSSNNSSIKFA
jgi:hypothetical protein